MAKGTDQAKFVITGEFNAEKLISDVESSIGLMAKKIDQKLSKIGTKINTSVSNQLKTGATGAANEAVAAVGKQVTGENKVTENKNKQLTAQKTINADIFTAVKRVLLWGAASRLVFQSYQKIQDSVKDIVELNKILVNIQKIRPTGINLDLISDDIINKAKKYGVAFEEIGETQRTFFQQGFNAVEVAKLTEAQLLGVTAAGLSASEAMELLVSSMTIFNIDAKNSISLIDKLQNVQANYAVSTQDLAAAMRRVGPVAEQLGGDIDHLIGVITALKTTTRKSGEFIGTALSTIFSRAITDVGANQLKTIGVDINETASKLRPLKDIVNDTAEAWKYLSDQERIATAFALGGRRRYAQVIALFNDYQIVLDASATASNSFGAALIAQQKEVQSVSRQMAIASETAREAGRVFVSAFSISGNIEEDFKRVASLMKFFSGLVKKSSKALAFFTKWVGAPVASIVVLNATLNILGNRITTMSLKALLGSKSLLAYDLALKKGTSSAVAFATAMSFANKAVLLTSVGIVVTGILALTAAFKITRGGANKLDDTFTNLEGTTDRLKKTLLEYQKIAQQFREVGGVKALDDFLGKDRKGSGSDNVVGILKEVARVSGDLSTITFDQFNEAIIKVRGSAGNTKEAFKDLSNIIGFMQATMGGVRQELESLNAEATTAASVMTIFAGKLARVLDTGDSYGQGKFFEDIFGKGSFFKDLFGKRGFEKLLDDFQSLSFNELSKNLNTGFGEQLMFPVDILLPEEDKIGKDIEKIGNAYASTFDVFAEKVFKGESAIADLANQSKFGKAAATTFLKELIKISAVDPGIFEAGTDVVVDFDIKSISDEQLKEALAKSVKLLKDPKVIEGIINQELKDKGVIDISKYLIGGGDAEAIAPIMRDIASFVGKEIPDALKKAEDRSSPFLKLFIQMQEAAIDAAKSAGLFAKKVPTEYKALATFVTDFERLDIAISLATEKAELLGKSLPKAQLSAVGSEINKMLDQISKADSINERIEAIQALNDEYEKTKDKLKGIGNITAEGNQQSISNLNDLIIKNTQKMADMRAVSEATKEAMGHLEAQLFVLARQYEDLYQSIRNTDNAYKTSILEIKNYTKEQANAIKASQKFEEAQVKLFTKLAKITSGGSFEIELGLDIKAIKETYEIRKRGILKNLSLTKLAFYEELNTITVRNKAQKQNILGAKNLTEFQRESNIEADKARDASIRTYESKRDTLQASIVQLAIDEKSAITIAKITSEVDFQKTLHKANLATIKAYYTALQNSRDAASGLSKSIGNISAQFLRIGDGVSFYKDLRIEQALIGRESVAQTKELNAQISDLDAQVIIQQKSVKLSAEKIQAYEKEGRVLEDILKNDKSITDEKIEEANKIYLSNRARRETLVIQKKQVLQDGENAITLADLNNLLSETNAIHQANLKSIENYASGIKTSISTLTEFKKAQQDIISSFDKLGNSGDFAKLLSISLNSITKDYITQNQALSAQIALAKQVNNLKKGESELYGDEVVDRLRVLGIGEEQLVVDEGRFTLNEKAISLLDLQLKGELESLNTQKKHLKEQQANELSLARMNALLDAAKDTQADINSLAAGYANSMADVVTNIADIINERGSIRTILEPFADAYIASVTDRLSKALQGYLDGVLESSIGGQLEELEAKLKVSQETRPYQIGGEIVQLKIIAGHEIGATIVEQKIIAAHQQYSTATGNLPQLATQTSTIPTLDATPITNGLYGVETGVDGLSSLTRDQLASTIASEEKLLTQIKNQKLQTAAIQGLGVILGNLVGGGGQSAGIGASVGGIAGSFLGPIGGLFGSIAGGLFGGLFDKKPEEEAPEPLPAEIYNANSDALRANTEALIKNTQDFSFMRQLLNAPANFIQPAYASLGGGAQITVEINAPVGNEQAVGEAVYKAVSKVYSNDFRRIGRRG